MSTLNHKIYDRIEEWRTRKITGSNPYVYLDGIWLKRTCGGEVNNVSVLVAFGVNQEGYREILGVMEGAKEYRTSWGKFLRHMKERGLNGVRLFISDKSMGLVDTLPDFYPEAGWQRCTVHFYKDVMNAVPHNKRDEAIRLVKTINHQ